MGPLAVAANHGGIDQRVEVGINRQHQGITDTLIFAFLRPEASAIARRRLCGVLPMSDHVYPFMGSLVLVFTQPGPEAVIERDELFRRRYEKMQRLAYP